MLKHSHLIYDWNSLPGAQFAPKQRVMLDDESLRDGLQSPSVKDPPIEEKLRILHLMEDLGIDFVDIGLPGAGPRAVADWMTQFPPAYWRGHLDDVLSYWNNGPPQEVFSWIEQQSPEIQGALAAEYQKPTGKGTVETVNAVLQFARADLRDQLLVAMFQHSIGSTWKMKEEIQNSSLTAEQKQHVLAIVAKVEKDDEATREERARAGNDQGSEK